MDKCYLDPIIGLVSPFDCIFGLVFTGVFVYVSLVKLHSIPLALSVVYNYLRDTAISLVPVVGDVADFFNRSYVRSQRLIDGFAYGDKEIIKKVNGQAGIMLLLSLLCTALIVLLIYVVCKLGDLLFTFIASLFG